MNTTLMCAAMNLKKLAIWLVKEPRIAWINRILIMILVENINLYKKQTGLINLSSVCPQSIYFLN